MIAFVRSSDISLDEIVELAIGKVVNHAKFGKIRLPRDDEYLDIRFIPEGWICIYVLNKKIDWSKYFHGTLVEKESFTVGE